jgi:putative transposase
MRAVQFYGAPSMTQKPHKGWHNRGYLPHFDTPGRAQHVVFRIAGPLPKSVTDGKDAGERFRRADAWLDRVDGDAPLARAALAQIVADALRFFAGERYELHAWCVMPNHVHALLTLQDGFRLGDMVRSWKTFSARRINAARAATGGFWAADYFDRYMRSEADFEATTTYIENNPVAAGLAARPEDWPWSSATKL